MKKQLKACVGLMAGVVMVVGFQNCGGGFEGASDSDLASLQGLDELQSSASITDDQQIGHVSGAAIQGEELAIAFNRGVRSKYLSSNEYVYRYDRDVIIFVDGKYFTSFQGGSTTYRGSTKTLNMNDIVGDEGQTVAEFLAPHAGNTVGVSIASKKFNGEFSAQSPLVALIVPSSVGDLVSGPDTVGAPDTSADPGTTADSGDMPDAPSTPAPMQDDPSMMDDNVDAVVSMFCNLDTKRCEQGKVAVGGGGVIYLFDNGNNCRYDRSETASRILTSEQLERIREVTGGRETGVCD